MGRFLALLLLLALATGRPPAGLPCSARTWSAPVRHGRLHDVPAWHHAVPGCCKAGGRPAAACAVPHAPCQRRREAHLPRRPCCSAGRVLERVSCLQAAGGFHKPDTPYTCSVACTANPASHRKEPAPTCALCAGATCRQLNQDAGCPSNAAAGEARNDGRLPGPSPSWPGHMQGLLTPVRNTPPSVPRGKALCHHRLPQAGCDPGRPRPSP